MGYSVLSVGDVVCIDAGQYAGAIGVVESPTLECEPYAVDHESAAMLIPVSVATVIDGVPHMVRVPVEFLARVNERS